MLIIDKIIYHVYNSLNNRFVHDLQLYFYNLVHQIQTTIYKTSIQHASPTKQTKEDQIYIIFNNAQKKKMSY